MTPSDPQKILAIDPGPEQSAFVVLHNGRVGSRAILPNFDLLAHLRELQLVQGEENRGGIQVAIEMIASMGMPVGKEVFETCLVIGRIQEILFQSNTPCRFVYRREVKMFLCGNMRAKDGNIRQSLIDLLGPVGTKKQPGPCYGIKSHLWSALAVAITARDAVA